MCKSYERMLVRQQVKTRHFVRISRAIFAMLVKLLRQKFMAYEKAERTNRRGNLSD